MPELVSQEELHAILQEIRRFPEGRRIVEVGVGLAIEIPRRTLQRRLNQLMDQGLIVRRDLGRGSRYYAGESAPESYGFASHAPVQSEERGSTSADADAIRLMVRRPAMERRPVGYNRDFLYSYQQNLTFYLPIELREHLATLCQTPEGERPAGTYARQIFDRLLIDLSWNSSRLGGNTYSLLETERLLKMGETAEGTDAREAQMILNHKMDKRAAAAFVKQTAARSVADNAARFIEVVEKELLSLHEGNIARYRLRPGEFAHWQEVWLSS